MVKENSVGLAEHIKHHRGYLFDSLVYRFKDYQSRAYYSEVRDFMYKRNVSEMEAKTTITSRHERDLFRFIQILDEAIGEHD